MWHGADHLAGTMNAAILLDEVDKMSADFRGDPAAALLEVLDPEQNHAFSDHYLEVPFDLSKTMFIATANFPHQIPGPLKDRMEAIEFAGYTENEKLEIAKRYLLPRQEELNGLRDDQLEVDDDAIREAAAALEEARERLASVPPEVVVTNHVMGLYELAAIHL